ncbi:MAG: hypothetical protein LBR17_06800 [Bacteroidales bacterium]|jgi:hypothetical protein|nr:hypothetical protein [Bacteroidales bacterium]
MIATAIVSFSSCGSDDDEDNNGTTVPILSDCYCYANLSEMDISVPMFVNDGTPTISNFNGNCYEVEWNDLSEPWIKYQGEGIILTCEEM